MQHKFEYKIIFFRSWLEAANNEKRTRGCFIELYTTHHDVITNIKNIRIKPSAGFFFLLENIPRNAESIYFILLLYSL